MRSRFGFLALLLLACSPSVEDVDGSSAAAMEGDDEETNVGTFRPSEDRRGLLDLVVRNGHVSGRYLFSSLSSGSCRFTLEGKLDPSGSPIKVIATNSETIITGYLDGVTRGRLGSAVGLRFSNTVGPCSEGGARFSRLLREGAGERLPKNVQGFRSVAAKRAFLYQTPNGAFDGEYVDQGSPVTITGSASEGFVPGVLAGSRERKSGYFREGDLAPTDKLPPPATPIELREGNYDAVGKAGWSLRITGDKSTANALLDPSGAGIAASASGFDRSELHSTSCGTFFVTPATDDPAAVHVTWHPTSHPFPREAECSLPEARYVLR
jgi:hypothetical protein